VQPEFRNWSRRHCCAPAAWAHPSTDDEIVALVKAANDSGRTVKVVGAGHSFSAIAMTDGVLVSLDRMDRVVSVDVQRGLVRVQAGMRLRDFNRALAEHGLSLPIVGSIAEQSLGGLVATGTHGSSLRHGNLATLIVAMRLVSGTGEVVELPEGDPRLLGARVNLGALGIVTEVTLRVESMFAVAEESVPMGFEAALAAFPAFIRDHEYAKLWWLPHTDAALLFRGDRVTEPSNISAVQRWIDEHIVNAWVFPAVLWLGNKFPSLIPPLNRVTGAVYFQRRRTVGPPASVLGLAMPPRHFEAEWAVPLAHGAEALRRVRDLAEGLRVNFILEARVVRGDDNWLSPAYGRDTIQIGTYITNPADRAAFFAGAEAIFADYGGRAHWGKENTLSRAEAERLYPRFADFRDLVGVMDPRGTLRNAVLQRLLD